ncbi:MAG TPA: putative oxidoreductase C-terminal domain-containing protein, partial [Puia sp.]
MPNTYRFLIVFALCTAIQAKGQQPIRLITLDPGHFHAALVQKSMYPGVDPVVQVYAPAGPDVQSHLDKVQAYNTREKDPTRWEEKVYTGNDYLQKMINDKAGNTVVLAGNNKEKTSYILQSLQAGFHVLGDKPMAIDSKGFNTLLKAFETAAARKRVLYDIMTERFEITSILQRELAMNTALFGTLEKGSPEHPAIVAESVHRWYKYVSGNVLTRPAWFFDVTQQGEGIVDVMTHLVDLVQWTAYPNQILDYKKDIKVNGALHWPTTLGLTQFKTLTKQDNFPGYLKKYTRVGQDTVLEVYANGSIDYQLRGAYVRTVATWTYQAPPGADDTYTSLMRGSKARLIIRQGPEQQYHPTLYIEPTTAAYGNTIEQEFKKLQIKYPGIELKKSTAGYEVLIPDQYKEGHESHFARVTEKFLGYVRHGNMPAWEVPGMLARYYTTTRALAMAASDTLTARIAPTLNGHTRDLARLRIDTLSQSPGQAFHRPFASSDDMLLIVKDGQLKVSIDSSTKKLGPGGIALIPAGTQYTLSNPGKGANHYFSFYL